MILDVGPIMKFRNAVLAFAAVAIICAIALGFLFVSIRPPLIPTNEWNASYRQNNSDQQPATVYQLSSNKNLIFIHTPDAEKHRYRWFALNLKHRIVGVPNAPRSFPYLHVQSANVGITLDFPKIEDSWKIDWRDDGHISFTNGTLDVAINQAQQGAAANP